GEFFGFPAAGGHIYYPYTLTANNTEFEDIYIYVDKEEAWADNIAALRIDPTTGESGTVQYDFIRFLKDSPLPPTSYAIAGEGGFTQINGLGNTLQMILSVEPELGNRVASWSVDDEAIATIDENGLITAVSAGDVTVTATATLDGAVSGTAVIVISDQSIDVTGVEVISYMSTITTIGGTLQMEAVVTPDDASNPAVIWSVDDEAVATINANGMLAAVAEGTVVVTAVSVDQPTISGTKSIVVSTAQISAWEFDNDIEGWGAPGGNGSNAVALKQADGALVIDVTGGDPHLYGQTFLSAWVVGDLKYLHLKIKNESNNALGQFFMWRDFPSTSIHSVAFPLDTLQTEFTDVYVDLLDSSIYEQAWLTDWMPENEYNFFRVDPIQDPGTAGTDRISIDFIRFISIAPPLESLSVTNVLGKDTIGTGTTLQMMAAAWPNISNDTVIWSVDDEAIATIDPATGLLTAVSEGEVTVTAISKENAAITATKEIVVIANVTVTAIDVTSDSDEIFEVRGTTMQMTATISPADATNQDYTWSVSDASIATIDL
ncbi:MAG: Ig-like domain-containing protein, partial [Anaerolineales bacterium]|nr:Ig-like domain-containing protein [Anaerolineales bacterium]